VRSELTADGFDASAVRYGVRSFRLVYRTVDSRGRPTTASGLQVVNANTWHCQAAFAAHGARVTAVNLGAPDHAGSRHFGSNVAGTAQIVRWFSQLAS
jgi:hypothetical protein